jgi:sirohydrochlorin cobaltochelatase
MTKRSTLGVVLIGHGAPATDCPPQLVGELMSLEWRAGGGHGHGGEATLRQRAETLDAQIRDWPRTPKNDPYKAGLERVAAALQARLPKALFAVGYNEFCRPSIPEAVAQVVRQGAARVLVVPTMLTPGGVHSEVDIPRVLAGVQAAHPGVAIEYVWPFDLDRVAALLAEHVRRAARQEPVLNSGDSSRSQREGRVERETSPSHRERERSPRRRRVASRGRL